MPIDSQVTVADPVTTSESILSQVSGVVPANGDIIEWESNAGAVSIAPTGIVSATSVPQTFDWRFWSASEGAWSNVGSVTLSAGGSVSYSIDTPKKRANAAGAGRPWLRGRTVPDAAMGVVWRASAGMAYGANLQPVTVTSGPRIAGMKRPISKAVSRAVAQPIASGA